MYEENEVENGKVVRKRKVNPIEGRSVRWENPPSTPPNENFQDRDFLTRNYKRLFFFPFILILVAVIVMGASNYPSPPSSNDYWDHDEYMDALERYNNIINIFQNTADILFTMGVLMLSFLFFMAPFVKQNFHPTVKIAMMAIGVIIITHFLTDGFKLQVIFG
ncbi:MAG: hypothetical protein ACMUIE_00175 [Thermoplasmatota archaeon]